MKVAYKKCRLEFQDSNKQFYSESIVMNKKNKTRTKNKSQQTKDMNMLFEADMDSPYH